jgi:hypothetical protein
MARHPPTFGTPRQSRDAPLCPQQAADVVSLPQGLIGFLRRRLNP